MDLILEDDCSLEYIVSQLQNGSKNIFCVINGQRLIIRPPGTPYPDFLEFQDTHKNILLGTTEYHYRHKSTGSLYVFFRPLTTTSATTVKIGAPKSGLGSSREVQDEGRIITTATIE